VESAETRAWVAAAEAGVEGGTELKVSRADAQCLARALVETVTVARLKAAGVTLAELSDTNKDLPPRLARSLSPATKLALGRALQACGGGFFGTTLAEGFAHEKGSRYRMDAAARGCVNRWFLSSDRVRIVAEAVLNEDPTKADSVQIADLIATCLDVAALLAPSFHFAFADTERACINQAARTSVTLRNALAGEISESSRSATTNAESLFGASVVKCLTPEHLLQMSEANN
jgi:hypothetical protein